MGALPVVLNAFVPDFTALCTLINPINLLVYLLFLPTMQGYFLTLSMARTFDLSWGNRSGVGGEIESLKVQSQSMMVLAIALNLVILITLSDTTTSAQQTEDIVLAIFMLAPMAVISFFSAMQAVGQIYFWLTFILEVAFLVLSHSYLPETEAWCDHYIHNSQLHDFVISVFRSGSTHGELYLLLWLISVILLKFVYFGFKFCFVRCQRRLRKPRNLDDSETASSMVETLTFQ